MKLLKLKDPKIIALRMPQIYFTFAVIIPVICQQLVSGPIQIKEELKPVIFSNPAFRHPSENNVTFEDRVKKRERGRVIGGKEANSGEIPYQVGIMMKDMGIWCGGSVLSNDTVITAAHCFYNDGELVNKTKFIFVAGKTNLSQAESMEQLSEAASITIHPKYSPQTGSYDLAIVKLQVPYCFNSRIQPISLVGPDITPSGKAWVSGWGYTLVRQFGEQIEEFSPKFSKVLKMTTLLLLAKDQCIAKYSNGSSPLYQSLSKHETVICAEALAGTDDACQGDSGGPLTCIGDNGNKTLCGVISCGRGCGLPNLPAFYTHLSYLHEWILKQAGPPGIPCTGEPVK